MKFSNYAIESNSIVYMKPPPEPIPTLEPTPTPSPSFFDVYYEYCIIVGTTLGFVILVIIFIIACSKKKKNTNDALLYSNINQVGILEHEVALIQTE